MWKKKEGGGGGGEGIPQRRGGRRERGEEESVAAGRGSLPCRAGLDKTRSGDCGPRPKSSASCPYGKR